jgi:DNA-binding phage protein
MSLTQVAKKHGISRASVCRLVKEASANPNSSFSALTEVPSQASAAGAAQ